MNASVGILENFIPAYVELCVFLCFVTLEFEDENFELLVSFVSQDIQVSLREEIKSACDYRPFEKCDYSSRIANEICCKKLEYVISQLDGMKQTIDDYHSEV